MPRILDIDILAIGDLEIHSGLLEIPHGGISERIFVLKPWNDIAPKFVVPGQNAMVSEILENTDDDSDVRMVLIFDKEEMI
jgi:7,8-dihydro-6-hydroxymethylpterin-pyrophosphokinase